MSGDEPLYYLELPDGTKCAVVPNPKYRCAEGKHEATRWYDNDNGVSYETHKDVCVSGLGTDVGKLSARICRHCRVIYAPKGEL